jgi:hypothetical protein
MEEDVVMSNRPEAGSSQASGLGAINVPEAITAVADRVDGLPAFQASFAIR